MKKQLLANMLAAIAALFTLMFALPQKAMAGNIVIIDGVIKSILSTDFIGGAGDDNGFSVYLYLSSDKKEYVQVRGNKNLHAIYGYIWLDKKEEKHEGQWYWDVIYTSYGKDKFWASGNPLDGYALFSSGSMVISGDPRTSRKICGIQLYGKVTDTKHGDGQEHTITIDYKHDCSWPSAGTLTMGTVTATSINLSWTHSSDETTPRDKLLYSVEYRKVGNLGWSMSRVGNATSYTIEGLEPETEYEVNIRVCDESGNETSYGVQTVTTKKATATKYGIKIGGVEITADNYTDISASNGFPAVKSGTVSYNPENRTLTLDNVVIETRNGVAIWFYDEEITHAYTLVLKGNGNRLTATLANHSNLTITGGGSAQITRKGDCGIFVNTDATLTITGGCSITAEGEWGIAGRDGNSETLIIDGATVKAKGNGEYGSICDFKEIVLKNCAITAPSGATVENGNVKLGGKVVTDWVTIEPTGTPQASNTVRIDGVEKPVLETKYETSGEEDFTIYLYLSEDNKEHIKIKGKKSKHFNKDIDLTKIEPATYYLEISYQTGGRPLFDGYLSPANGLAFTTGTFRIDGDPAGTFTITLNDGKITDVDYGDGKEHTFSIKCSYVPPTGIDTPTADVPARKQGVYNLQGVRLGTSLDRLPKGIYVVDGRKVVKK